MKSKLIKVLYSTRSRGGSSCFHGSSYIETPKIQMEGKWLETLGFHIGDRLQVDYEEGAIHIRLAPEPEPQPAMVCEPGPDYGSNGRKGKRKQ
ncbi:MAG TPA: hypothetical protein DCZ91_20675 [Lachnospiraceae bacterium]|nr:hypothetical protein [Lachnospiraceae bacterium]